jgi:hypothetical protein
VQFAKLIASYYNVIWCEIESLSIKIIGCAIVTDISIEVIPENIIGGILKQALC